VIIQYFIGLNDTDNLKSRSAGSLVRVMAQAASLAVAFAEKRLS
jgi:hypothetical protein